MKKIGFAMACAILPLTLAAPAQAQRGAASPAILVVDTDRILSECTACVTASNRINTMVQQTQQLAQQLGAPLQTEGEAIETAVAALKGRTPDAALQKRVQDFRTKENQAQQQLAASQNNVRSVQAHVTQQLGTRLVAIVEQVRNSRGALVALNKNSTLANAASAEVTNEVLAELNRQVPAVSVTPLPQQAAPAQPAARPATTPAPAQPQPTGR